MSLRDHCGRLSSDKVTERKKSIESLKQELRQQKVQHRLDRKVDRLGWDNVFRAVCEYMQKETEYLKKDKGASSTTLSTKDRKKQEVGGVFKWFVRIANQRGEQLECSSIVQHVLTLMGDKFTASAYGVDCCSVLLKDVLRSHKYYCELPQKMWQELLVRFCKVLLNPVPSLSHDLVSRLVRSILAGAVVQSALPRSSMLNFFSQIISTLRSEKSATVVENVLSALNTFSASISGDCRNKLCKLGEDSLADLMHVWRNQSAAPVKKEIIEFLRLQMTLHHPRGVAKEQEGAYAADITVWKTHLQHLYELLLEDWKQAGSRIKLKAAGSREIVFKAAIVDLAADVFHQIFSGSYSTVELASQVTPDDPSQSTCSTRRFEQGGSGAKRRKMESGWNKMRETITSLGQNASVVPWLQLLRALLYKYPTSLPGDQLLPLVSALQQIQAESKRGEVQTWILQALQALAGCQCQQKKLPSVMETALHVEWTKVWSCAIRTISLHTAESEGFDLLTCLLHHGIVRPDREHWRLFLPDSAQPTRNSVQFIVTFLSCHSLPENHTSTSNGVLASTAAATKGNYPLRHQLLNWLLPTEDQDEPGERLQLVKLLKCLPTDIVAHVLGILTRRTTQAKNQMTSAEHHSIIKTERTRQDAETLYLQSSFNVLSQELKDGPATSTDRDIAVKGSSSIVASIKQSLMQRLERVGVQVLEFSSNEVASVEALIHYASLLCKSLAKLLELEALTDEEIAQSQLAESLKTLLKRVTTALRNLWQKTETGADTKVHIQSLSSLIVALDGMFTWDHCFASQAATGSARWLADMFQAVTPRALLDTLFEIVKKKGSNSATSKSSGTKMAAKDPFSDEVMDMELDDEFDDNSNCKDDFDMNSSVLDDGVVQKASCQSFLSTDALSDAEQLALQSAQLICSWCLTGARIPHKEQPNTSRTGLISTSNIQDKFLELVEEEVENHKTAFAVQLFFTVAESFLKSKAQLDDDSLLSVQCALWSIASKNHEDHELCTAILSLLSRLIPFLQSDKTEVSTSLKEAREVPLRLLAIFWKRRGIYTAPVRLAIAQCMHALILIDPTREWTVLKSKAKDKERGQGDNERTVAGEFCLLLKDESHSVRMYMALAIKCLFCCRDQPFTKAIQNLSFDMVYQTAQEAMEIQGNMIKDEHVEELANRTASLLATLSTIARCSPACEKKTVFALMQAVRLNHIEIPLMTKVIGSIGSSLRYASVTVFLQSHLGYLIHQWLLEDYKLPQFPFQLLGCPTEVEFYRKYHGAIIPHLVTSQGLDTVRDIAKSLGTNWIELVKQSFPQSIAHILPLFGHTRAADEDGESADYQARRTHAMVCFAALEKTLGKEMIDSLIQGHLDSIVVELLAMLYEPHNGDKDLLDFTSDTDPEPCPPFFTTYTIKATLDYLTKCHAGGKALTLVSLLAKTQDSIQKILLALHIRISKSQRAHEKHRMVLAYRLFVLLLLEELPTGLGGSWVMVLQDVIYTLVHTVREGDESGQGAGLRLAQLCLDVLHHVCVTALEHCHEELGKHLHIMMGLLVPLAEKDNHAGNQAQSLINLLVIDSNDKLSDSLQYLDPLPDSPRLSHAKKAQQASKYTQGQFTLMEEINHFLMVGNQQRGVPRIEGLRHLHQHLASKKDELLIMVQQCAEGSDRTIIQLITELVAMGGADGSHGNVTDQGLTAVREEVARCLGDIGAPNLSTVALHCDEIGQNVSYATALKVFANDPVMCRHAVIIHLMKDYLTDSNVDTIQAAANCLKTVLATASGQRCFDTYKEINVDKLFHYLQPFKLSKKKGITKPALPSDASFTQTIGDPSLWQPMGGNHSDWVRNLTVALIRSGAVKDEILLLLEPICKVKVEFAEKVLPYLFHDMLTTGNDEYRTVLSQRLEAVFAGHCEAVGSSRAPTPVPFLDASSNFLGQRSIRTLLDVMQYLRTQERPTKGRSKSTAWDNNFWLDVNYLLVAKAAQNCRAHFTCLLYTEIWCDVQRSRQGSSAGKPSASDSLSQPSDIETLNSFTDGSNVNAQTLLLEAYSSIGEPDSAYGFGAGRLTDTYARIHTYEHECDWNKALSAYDLKLHSKSAQTGQQEVGVLQAMQNLGLSHILTVYLDGLRSEGMVFGPEMAQFQYEAAWRNAIWDLELDDGHQTTPTGYHQSLYTALSCLRDAEYQPFTVALQQARMDTMQQCCVNIDSAYSFYPMLSRLQGLVEMENFSSVLLNNTDPISVLESWKSQLALMDNDFEFAEPALALRTVMLQLLLEKSNTNNHNQAYKGLVEHLKNQTEMARKAASFQIAEKSLANLQHLERHAEPNTDHVWWRLVEEAKVYWTRNEQTTAMHLMKALLDKISRVYVEDPIAKSLHPEVLTIYGNWLAETNSDSPNVIIEQYLERAVEMYDLNDDTSAPAIEAQLSLARFADTQYQNIVNYAKSSEYEAKQALMKRAKKEHAELEAMGDKTSRYARMLHKQSEIDELELGSMMQDRENFLQKALECYLKCLESGTAEHDMRVFRVCSLWFDNSNEDRLSEVIQDSFDRIETRKFLPLLYQLAARMTTKTQDKQLFHDLLNQVIEKTARDHPHHALPIILALANANKDAVITSSKTGRLARTSSMRDADTSHADEARMRAAQKMLQRLRTTQCAPIIAGLEKLSDAYIQLAYWDVSDRKKETGPLKLPSSQPLTQLRDLQHVAMPTMEVHVDPTCRYEDIVSIAHFDGSFRLAGGINLPKIITCVGSDGMKRRQLVKGKDDLRQDAVMQQVFGLVNKLLQRNQETRKRRLQIRTYKIVPLSQRSGLLEWCEGTMPIGEYLIGNQKTDYGAHRRYRPQDFTSMECRKKMQLAHNSSEQGKKYREFLEVMKRFQPVFRHFFLEKFPDPAVWLERRLAYTRSVATSSIVGYVVGLGDRHVQNILVDCNLAELVHIDLGVAFEQGRILPTPETVPFRLTRDLVDGMGIAGVEGVFRRCCEKTMDVMHNSEEALLTILQVLLYDPLYVWTMSPQKAMALQQRRDRTDPDASELNTTSTDLTDGDAGFKGQQDSSEGTEVNKVAERVVLRLRQKLQGVEEGVAMSVKGQVNRLIQEARDPKNLCRLFPGWQPWI